jgi:hypothetical protein
VLLPAVLPSMPFDDISHLLDQHDKLPDSEAEMVVINNGDVDQGKDGADGGV